MKKNNNKGFTLAELLIVVAIIAVLVAIAIPVFTQQLEKSREATDLANIRAAYGQAITDYLTDNQPHAVYVEAKQTDSSSWLTNDPAIGTEISAASGNSGGASRIDLSTVIASTNDDNHKYFKVNVDKFGTVKVTATANNTAAADAVNS